MLKIVRTEGKALIPDRLMAMTNGDDAAVPPLRARPLELDGTSKPMIVVPRM